MRKWVTETFGLQCFESLQERASRVTEEAIELAQVCEVPQEYVQKILERVYSRDVGEIHQEIGGVATTLLALTENIGEDLEVLIEQEISRIEAGGKTKFKKKHLEKLAAGTSFA